MAKTTARGLRIADLRMEMVARVAAGAALIVVVASFTYSFWAMKWVSDQLGADPEALSYVFPFIIDLPALVASALTVALHDRDVSVRRYAWSVLILFTSMSWACNAIHAAAHSTITQTVPAPAGTVLVVLIAGFPPIGVVLGMHLWAFALRHSTRADLRADGTAAPAARAPRAAQPRAPKMIPDGYAPVAQPRATVTRMDDEQVRAREAFDKMVAADPHSKPVAAEVHREAEVTKDIATSRRWVQRWWDEFQADLGMSRPELLADPPRQDRASA